VYDTLTEASEGYEKALMNIDHEEQHSDRSLISKDLELQNIDQSFKESLKQHRYFMKVKNALSELHQNLMNGTTDPKNASSTLSAKFEALGDNHEESENTLNTDPKYLEFRQSVWKCRNPNTDFIEYDGDSDDDEIRVMRQVIDVKCPLTVMDYCNTLINLTLIYREKILIRPIPLTVITFILKRFSSISRKIKRDQGMFGAWLLVAQK